MTEERGEGKAGPGEGSIQEGFRECGSEPTWELPLGTSERGQVSCLLTPHEAAFLLSFDLKV